MKIKEKKTKIENRIAININGKSCYLNPEKLLLNDCEKNLRIISEELMIRLSNTNYDGCTFTDLDSGIKIRGYHKEYCGQTWGNETITLKYNFSNMEECINEFVESWIESEKIEKERF